LREVDFGCTVIGEVLGHLDQYIGDAFLEYRIRKLIDAGVFELEGDLKARRFYSLRLNRKKAIS
jgi:hypothetical protein